MIAFLLSPLNKVIKETQKPKEKIEKKKQVCALLKPKKENRNGK